MTFLTRTCLHCGEPVVDVMDIVDGLVTLHEKPACEGFERQHRLPGSGVLSIEFVGFLRPRAPAVRLGKEGG